MLGLHCCPPATLQLQRAGFSLQSSSFFFFFFFVVILLWSSCSRVQAQSFWNSGLVAPMHLKSSQTRDQTYVPCIGRRILNHWPTREALFPCFYYLFTFLSLLLEAGSTRPRTLTVLSPCLQHVPLNIGWVNID